MIKELLNLTPDLFECEVEKLIRELGSGLSEFKTQRLEKITGSDGDYEIDITARFEGLGASFLVLIECKKHKYPIKRDIVQVLHDRVRAVGAQKGMIFSTSKFQRGAIEYAQKHSITLVQVADGKTCYFTRGYYEEETQIPPWVPKYVGWVVGVTDEGEESYKRIDNDNLGILLK
jgi:restriction system protein